MKNKQYITFFDIMIYLIDIMLYLIDIMLYLIDIMLYLIDNDLKVNVSRTFTNKYDLKTLFTRQQNEIQNN